MSPAKHSIPTCGTVASGFLWVGWDLRPFLGVLRAPWREDSFWGLRTPPCPQVPVPGSLLPAPCSPLCRSRCGCLSLRHGGHRSLGHQRCALWHHPGKRAEPGGGAARWAGAAHRGPGPPFPVSALYPQGSGPPLQVGQASETVTRDEADGTGGCSCTRPMWAIPGNICLDGSLC